MRSQSTVDMHHHIQSDPNHFVLPSDGRTLQGLAARTYIALQPIVVVVLVLENEPGHGQRRLAEPLLLDPLLLLDTRHVVCHLVRSGR
jgi:hypothetical protein